MASGFKDVRVWFTDDEMAYYGPDVDFEFRDGWLVISQANGDKVQWYQREEIKRVDMYKVNPRY